MRDATDDINPFVESTFKVFHSAWRSVITVLRKGDELQIDVRRHSVLHIEQRVDRKLAVVANVDMAAYREKSARHS
jgi:hypothetical protein